MSRPAPEDVRTITCVGAGVIGGGWVAYVLARGDRVVAWDPAEDAVTRLRHLVGQAWPALVELGPGYRFRTEVLGEGRLVGNVWRDGSC